MRNFFDKNFHVHFYFPKIELSKILKSKLSNVFSNVIKALKPEVGVGPVAPGRAEVSYRLSGRGGPLVKFSGRSSKFLARPGPDLCLKLIDKVNDEIYFHFYLKSWNPSKIRFWMIFTKNIEFLFYLKARVFSKSFKGLITSESVLQSSDFIHYYYYYY